MSDLVSDEKLTEALEYLADTDIEFGTLRGQAKRLDYMLRKVTRGKGILESEETSDSRRIADAESGKEYLDLLDELCRTEIALYRMAAKRETSATIIDVWRTEQASKRKGHL